jgi:hypothetical protein
LAVYIIKSVMHGHTNIGSQFEHRHIFEALISFWCRKISQLIRQKIRVKFLHEHFDYHTQHPHLLPDAVLMSHNRNFKKDIDIANQPAKYMDHSSSSETNSSSASQETGRILWNPYVHASCPQQPAPCPYPEVD